MKKVQTVEVSNPMENTITVVLNCYKRPEYLEEQIKAIREQSKAPTQIWLWVNQTQENKKFKFHTLGLDKVFRSDTNCKYHGRFAVALLAQTKYVAFFDDDTIPGSRWFENCLDTMKETPGILGGAGCILGSRLYAHHARVGWPSRNVETTQVDLVGHAWFLRREDLNYMWREIPFTFENGEDIQLSYLAKKYGDVNTYCPPHPSWDISLHSSTKPYEYGNDSKASSNGSLMPASVFYQQRNECVSYAIDNGWETINKIC